MASYRQYVIAKTPEEAYELNQKKSTVIVAGNMWLRMCGMHRTTALDLSALSLEGIEDCGDRIRIGAMTTLREAETSPLLAGEYGDAFRNALNPIVGTQFRNTATVGGSVFSRFGFSDVSTLLLALNAEVKLYRRGIIPLRVFQTEKPDRDILLEILIPKKQRAGIRTVRFEATDFPVLACACSLGENGMRAVVGARPGRAVIAAENLPADFDSWEEIAEQLTFGSNLRAGAEYRKAVAPVLLRRAAEDCRKEAGEC